MKQLTDFGEIPIEWNVDTILNISSPAKRSIAMGPFGSNIKAENFVSSGVPVIRGTNMNFSRYVDGQFVYLTEEKADDLSSSNCLPDDLVFTHRGTIGQVALIPQGKFERYVISQSGMKLTVNKEIVNPNFLFYFFKSEYGQYQILKYESQVGVPSISNPLTSLKEIQVPVPSLSEQKAIADVLSALDDKIDLLQRQNETLEKMAETLFRQWFIEENNSTGSIFLGEMIDIHDSKRIPLSKMEREQKKRGCILYPYYGAANIMDYIDEYIFDGNYLLIGEDGTVQDENGYPILQRTTGKFWVNNHAHIVSALEPYSNFFIWCLLSKTNVEKIITGAVQPKINQGNLKSLEFNSFDFDKVQRFVKLTTSMEEKIYINNMQIQTLQNMRDTLLPKLMSGEVRVKLD